MTVIRWGIASTGRISHDFCNALLMLKEKGHKIVAVAARDVKRAEDFARKRNIPKFYGSYKALSQDSDAEVIYVGSVTSEHHKITSLMLNAGKNVLCEKPLGMNARQVKEMSELAKKKNVFFMEGIWSRFTPVYRQLRRSLEGNELGKPLTLLNSFCVDFSGTNVLKRDGIMQAIGVYSLQLALLVFGSRRPTKAVFTGGKATQEADLHCSMLLEFEPGQTAQLHVDGRYNGTNDAVIYFEGGTIKVDNPFWTALDMTTTRKPLAKDPKASSDTPLFDDALPLVASAKYPLPGPSPLPMNFPYSENLVYQADQVKQHILQGHKESALMSLEESLIIAELVDAARSAIGVSHTAT